MNRFIKKGYLNKHIRNVINVSIERKEVFSTHFMNAFENSINIDPSNQGLHVIGRFKQSIDDKQFSKYLLGIHRTNYSVENGFFVPFKLACVCPYLLKYLKKCFKFQY